MCSELGLAATDIDAPIALRVCQCAINGRRSANSPVSVLRILRLSRNILVCLVE